MPDETADTQAVETPALVTMRYRIKDFERFEAAVAWTRSLPEEEQGNPAASPPRFFRCANDPSAFLLVEEWPSLEATQASWKEWEETHRSEWLRRAGLDASEVERMEWEPFDFS